MILFLVLNFAVFVATGGKNKLACEVVVLEFQTF